MTLLPRVSRCCVHSYLRDLVRRQGIVVDLGANRGMFARTMAQQFGCVVHAMEPVPDFHPLLRQIHGVRLHETCLAPSTGQVELSVPEGGDATLFSVQDAEVETLSVAGVTLEDFFTRQGLEEVDLLKMDIEGAELPALEQASPQILRRSRQITVEFHDWMFPETSERVERVKRRLQRLGFYCVRFSANNGDVLFVRRDILSFIQYVSVAFLVRNMMGARRIIGRFLSRDGRAT